MRGERCPFCELEKGRVFWEGELAFGLWDGYPVNPGHALIIPRRHVASWFEATDEEKGALMAGVEKAKAVIEETLRPDGYNIGVNVGAAAGQTVFHLHVHLIPRYQGDVPNPRGGVRNVIHARGNY